MQANNTQDINSNQYIAPPNSLLIQSHSPNSISLIFDNHELASQISIDRQGGGFDTSYVISKNENGNFIDDQNVVHDNQYNYSARYYNDNGYSDFINGELFHDFPGVENFNIDIINENSVNINWSYGIQEHFNKTYESLNWKIVKEKYNENSQSFEDPVDINLLMPISENGDYTYSDTDNIEINDSLKYSISLNINNIESDIVNQSMRIDLPQLDSLLWIPMNSSSIGIYWDIESSGVSNSSINSVTIYNNFNSNDYLYQGTDISGFFIDSLTNANISISPNQEVEYTIEWCGLNECMDSVFLAKTFPVYNMQYIPAMNNIDFNGHTISTEAFYIDIYEVHNNIFLNNDNLNSEPMTSVPKSNINFQEARDYCNNRSNSYWEQNFVNVYSGNNVNNNNLGFRLPTESEWYVAAAVLYNWEDGSTTNFDYTVQVGSGAINCNYGNILNCGGEAKDVGSYSDLSDCTYCLESTSPNGLYDCNGNVKEWVEKSSNIYEDINFQYPHSNNQLNRGVIMGGDFMSPASQSKNDFLIYENLDFEHPTIGFRTIIPANPFLNSIQ